MAEFKIADLVPMMPNEGPPLPRLFGIYWPWYKPGQIALKAGWNQVTYTGKSEKAGVATQSIAKYLVLIYYYDAVDKIWKLVTGDTILEPNMGLNINVSQDCTWTF